MYSFYGGRPGISFLLVKNYSSIELMQNDFLDDNCEVHYGEYVIINSSDSDNGKIYKRGYDKEPLFICQISGPPGPPSSLNFVGYNEISEGQEGKVQGNFSMVPGRTGNADEGYQYNNTIKFKYFTSQDEATQKWATTAGVQIPYPVIDINLEYGDVTAITKNNSNENHPFYHSFTLTIPEQLTTNFEGIKILQKGADISDVIFPEDDDYETQKNNHTSAAGTLTNPIWVYIKKKKNNGEEIFEKYFIQDFQIISNMDITNEGYLKITFPDTTEVETSNKIIPTLSAAGFSDAGFFETKWELPNGETQTITDSNNSLNIVNFYNKTKNSITDLITQDGILYATSDYIQTTAKGMLSDATSSNNEDYANGYTASDGNFYIVINNIWYKKIAEVVPTIEYEYKNGDTVELIKQQSTLKFILRHKAGADEGDWKCDFYFDLKLPEKKIISPGVGSDVKIGSSNNILYYSTILDDLYSEIPTGAEGNSPEEIWIKTDGQTEYFFSSSTDVKKIEEYLEALIYLKLKEASEIITLDDDFSKDYIFNTSLFPNTRGYDIISMSDPHFIRYQTRKDYTSSTLSIQKISIKNNDNDIQLEITGPIIITGYASFTYSSTV